MTVSDEFAVLQERIAKAIYAEGGWCGLCEFGGWDTCAECRQTLLGYAVAVLAALGLEQVGWLHDADTLDPAPVKMSGASGAFYVGDVGVTVPIYRLRPTPVTASTERET